MLPEIPLEQFVDVLDRVAGGLLKRCELVEPPVDAIALARQLGITVAWDNLQSGRARCVKLSTSRGTRFGVAGRSAQPSILIKRDPRAERIQWAVAHELGEHLSSEVFDQLGVDPREAAEAAREQVANQLANRILLPAAWLLREGRMADWELLALKRRFTTASYELIARRMLDVGPCAVMTVLDQGTVTWRRGSFGGRLPPWSALEKRSWHIAHLEGIAHEGYDRRGRVRVWPVHEPQWKREIVRLEQRESSDLEEEDWR